MLFLFLLVSYSALVLGISVAFFWTRTGVFWYFVKSNARQNTLDSEGMVKRFEAFNEKHLLASYAKIQRDGESFIVKVEGYPETVFSAETDATQQIAKYRGKASSERLSHNGLELSRMFLQIYHEERCDLAAEIAIKILEYWFSNRIAFSTDPHAWSVTVVSQRRLSCIVCLGYLKENSLGDDKLHDCLLNEIYACEKHLAKGYTYDWSTNHGLMDDYNILLGDFVLDSGEAKRRSQWRSKSLVRIDYFVSNDGVVLEPATSYWFMIKFYMKKIIVLHEMMDLQIEEPIKKKFESLERWLAFVSVNGLYSRIGDTSGANVFDPPYKYKHDQDGVLAYRTDTGLCYLNVVDNLEVSGQLFLNGQYCPPLTHAHQDALAINLISDGVVWINSPGYFSPSMKDFGINIRSVKNQSTVWCPKAGYQPVCKVESAEVLENSVSILTSVKLPNHCVITRSIEYYASSGLATIIDETNGDEEIQSSFVFDASVKAQLLDDTCRLRHLENKTLDLNYVADQAELLDCPISYKRNQLEETTKLVLSGKRNLLSFQIAAPNTQPRSIPSSAYPYDLRRKLSMPAPERLRRNLARLHFQRVKQAVLGLSLLFAVIGALAIIF